MTGTYEEEQEHGSVSNQNSIRNPSNDDEEIIDSDGTSSDREESGKILGRLLLLAVAFLYGTLNVALRWVYELPGPPSASALSCSRGWLASLCFVPFLIQTKSNRNHNDNSNTSTTSSNVNPTTEEDERTPLTIISSDEESTFISSNSISSSMLLPPLWKIAIELAIWNFGAQGLLNIGLIYDESARASFLTQCSVVMTPLVSVVAGHKVNKVVWIACAVALLGLTLLSGKNGSIGNHITYGDCIVLAGALCWSMYIFRLSAFGNSYSEIQLQASKTFFLAILYSIWFIFSAQYNNNEGTSSSLSSPFATLWPGWTNPMAWIIIFYSALGPGTIADLIQQKGQAKVTAAESNVILSMEPVFTALLGRLLLAEETSVQEKIGGGLIVIAALVATR